ncbi:uncharacterized protein LOC130755371 [Actinidia eriantha]|uniref:uncharacterized protein LOC130755371 n=1 Tax=Actinidia eriantha TaxID=165200 RepID=UPI002587DAAF|nr:uncharacterized protein LOC130755371 [Actinidia eriantha]
MEEKPELSAQATITDDEKDGGGDEEFYEKIEAPKFVDFTAPDPYRPDDRYWFCLRVGCDQKHEEEIDPEAISKNFLLRVMAARSPYIKLRQILNKKASSVNEKCPLSAPPKTSKSRVSRLAVISSFSQKMVDGKGKAKPLSKLNSTSNAKGKQVAAKYLTTPRNKKCLPNPNSFRSVQNPKTSIVVPKNRTVAKALVFHSPKKAISIKTSVELRTPLTKICEGMKRLEINGQRKRVLGYSNKLSKEIRRDPNKSLPVDSSIRQLSACKNKNKARPLSKPPNCKGKETKSLRLIKRKSKGNSEKPCNSQTVENDSSAMEINMTSREGSLLGDSRVTEGNYEERLTTEKTSGSFDSVDSTKEQAAIPCVEIAPLTNSNAVLPDASKGEMNSSSSLEGECLEENDFSKFQENSEEGKKSREGIDCIEKTKPSSEKRESLEDDKTESQTGGGGHEGEAMDSDDKENALASDCNRGIDFDHNTQHLGRLGKTKDIAKKVARAQEKILKEGLTLASAGAQGVKYRKPKPTNPKPFRLRTDERGILKEANLDRRIQPVASLKETAAVIGFSGGILHKKHGNEVQRKEKCLEQSKCNHDTHESSGNELEKILQKGEPKQGRTAGLTTPERQARPKTASITPQRRSNSTLQKPKPVTSRLVCGRDVTSQKSENNLRKTKSSSLQRQFISPKGVASTRKTNGSYLKCATQLTMIKETLAANKATTSASRSLSRGKRPATVPKEPNFHGVHVPKTCTRKVT